MSLQTRPFVRISRGSEIRVRYELHRRAARDERARACEVHAPGPPRRQKVSRSLRKVSRNLPARSVSARRSTREKPPNRKQSRR
jgi:hypothetical protein